MNEQMLIKALNQAPISEKQLLPATRNELQRTKEWYVDRLGYVTGTDAETLLSGLKTKKIEDLVLNKVWENLIDTSNELFMEQRNAMAWGNEHEAGAIEMYEKTTKRKVKSAKFYKNKSIKGSGSSVDGYVGHDGLIEVKCPYNGANHVSVMLSNEIESKYFAQIQKQLFDTGRKYCDYVSYDPRLKAKYKIHIIRILPDEKMFAEFKTKIVSIAQMINEKLQLIK